jgi:hypothetical protein
VVFAHSLFSGLNILRRSPEHFFIQPDSPCVLTYGAKLREEQNHHLA